MRLPHHRAGEAGQGHSAHRHIGDTLARLSTKCICEARSKALARYFTTTKEEGGGTPLQLGVGMANGTELVVHTARLLLESNPAWACVSGDIRNGFNTVSREAVLRALGQGSFSDLLPVFSKYYCREAPLFAGTGELCRVGNDGVAGTPIRSTAGVRQGDPTCPLLFSLALPPCARGGGGRVPRLSISRIS